MNGERTLEFLIKLNLKLICRFPSRICFGRRSSSQHKHTHEDTHTHTHTHTRTKWVTDLILHLHDLLKLLPFFLYRVLVLHLPGLQKPTSNQQFVSSPVACLTLGTQLSRIIQQSNTNFYCKTSSCFLVNNNSWLKLIFVFANILLQFLIQSISNVPLQVKSCMFSASEV